MSDEYERLLSFDRDSSDFARGVEVGMAWARLSSEPRPLTMLAHGDNTEMVLRMAEAHGVRATATETGGDWLEVTFQDA